MRNLVRYPITVSEIEDCLRRMSKELSEKNGRDMRCGDMRPLLLDAAATIVQRAGFLTWGLGGTGAPEPLDIGHRLYKQETEATRPRPGPPA